MTIKDRIQQVIQDNVESSYAYSSVDGADTASEKIEEVLDDFAIQFAKWFSDHQHKWIFQNPYNTDVLQIPQPTAEVLQKFKAEVYFNR